jgi:hypothetical protein
LTVVKKQRSEPSGLIAIGRACPPTTDQHALWQGRNITAEGIAIRPSSSGLPPGRLTRSCWIIDTCENWDAVFITRGSSKEALRPIFLY